MKTEKDILKSTPELRTTPYSVPEGYFDRMKAEALSRLRESEDGRRPVLARLAPYAAMAAVFVFLVTAGTFLLEKTTPSRPEDMDEMQFYSSIMPVTDPYAIESVQDMVEVADEDIIEYLIYSGVTAEVIELSK